MLFHLRFPKAVKKGAGKSDLKEAEFVEFLRMRSYSHGRNFRVIRAARGFSFHTRRPSMVTPWRVCRSVVGIFGLVIREYVGEDLVGKLEYCGGIEWGPGVCRPHRARGVLLGLVWLVHLRRILVGMEGLLMRTVVPSMNNP